MELCDNPACGCCYPENEHRCNMPAEGGTCSECGQEWFIVPFEQWDAHAKKAAETMAVGPVLTTRRVRR